MFNELLAFAKQPQLLVGCFFRLRLADETTAVLPQSHKQYHLGFPSLELVALEITSREVNFSPSRSTSFMYLLHIANDHRKIGVTTGYGFLLSGCTP